MQKAGVFPNEKEITQKEVENNGGIEKTSDFVHKPKRLMLS